VELGVKLYQSSSLTALIAAEYGEPFTVNVTMLNYYLLTNLNVAD
jgi:hypothetical protein